MTDPRFTPASPPEEVDGPTALAIARLAEVRSEMEMLKGEAEVLTGFIAAHVKRSTVITGPDGEPWRATVVRPKPRVAVDLHVLSRYPELYEATTKRVLDTNAFKRAARAGAITAEMVASICTFSEALPSVRFTPFGSEDTDTEETTDD